jgi:hypothetical protein
MNSVAVKDFINIAMKRILAVGDQPATLTPSQTNDAIYTLNEILDSWNADGKMIFAQGINTFPIGNSQQVYTIGPGGNFNVPTRPSYIEFASFQMTTSSPFVDIPIRILNVDEWNSIRIKNLATTVSFYLYMDANWPLANIYLWPEPSVGANLVLTYWNFLNSTIGINDTISMPPGYVRAVGLDLAINMAPMFGKAGSPTVAQLASTLSKIKSDIGFNNLRGQRMQYSGAAQGVASRGAAYDALTDTVF